MSWPYDTRLRTYASSGSNSYIRSADLNSIQDAILDINGEKAGDLIWVDLACFGTDGSDWDRSNPASAPYTGEQYVETSTSDGVWTVEISDWPEGMTLNSIQVDWHQASAGSTHELIMYAARQVWPASSGSSRTLESLHTGNSYVACGATGSRRWDTFTPDDNNTSWDHATHKLVLQFKNADNAINSRVYGIRLNVDYFGINKWYQV